MHFGHSFFSHLIHRKLPCQSGDLLYLSHLFCCFECVSIIIAMVCLAVLYGSQAFFSFSCPTSSTPTLFCHSFNHSFFHGFELQTSADIHYITSANFLYITSADHTIPSQRPNFTALTKFHNVDKISQF